MPVNIYTVQNTQLVKSLHLITFIKKAIAFAFFLLNLSSFTYGQSFDPVLSSKLQNTIDSMRIANNVKGISSCVIYPGQGTWKGVSGISHPGTPINSNMEFGIASNTKLFTGVLLLKLAENNLIQLDDSLHEYLPSYNNIDSNITIRQLLNHTSGLDDVTNVPGYPDSMMNNPNRVFTPNELMGWAGPPIFAPGTGWSYCNTNYLLAGMIAENVTGQPYGRLLHDSILTPLQMDSTFLGVYDSILFPVAHPWQAGFNNNSIPRTSVNSAAWSAGAMYSTCGEMAHWYHSIMSGQVLNPNSFNKLTTFVGSGNYGMGIAQASVLNNRTVWYHGGQIWGGYNSSMMYDTLTGIVICVLANQLPAQAYQISIQLLSTIINNSVGIDELYVIPNNINIFPNPSEDFIEIDLQGEKLNYIKIYNISGELTGVNNQKKFSISGLQPGIYFLKIETEKGIYTKKLIRQQ